VERAVSPHPLEDVTSKGWSETTSAIVTEFSAVGYYFGKELNERTGIPIGVIQSAWGGTPADAWTSLRGLSSDASLVPVFAEWSRMNDGHARAELRYKKAVADWEAAERKAKAEGIKPPGDFPWMPNEKGSWNPAGLFNAMIAPLTKAPIRGAIWYQGESNTSPERRDLYARLFQTMIRDWRRAWGHGDFPFLFTQLANWKSGPNTGWPAVREAQRDTLSLANTGMAVTIDIGNPDDIHPRNKQDVGKRLALWARAISYGEKLVYSGPLFRQATVEGGVMRVWFDHAASGLVAQGALEGFEIAGADGKWLPADARIDGSTVVVSSHVVEAPVAVRYAWSDNPRATLFNAEKLPASPFTSRP
jgi:sialate O-acetylesterase